MFRIIVAEDEPLILQSICEKIRASDPDFRIAGEYENGEYAMLELELIKPHILLTDIYMPVKDGLSLIEHVKKNSPSTICAVLTGYRDFDYARKAIELGVSDYLLKPPTSDTIAKFLAEVKLKLRANQSLIESELLQQWAYHKEGYQSLSSDIRQLAHEYFYYARYIVLYAWTPPQQNNHLAGSEERWSMGGLLDEGEKAYLIPSVAGHEQVIVVGVHTLSDSRLIAFAEFAASVHSSSACVGATSVGKLQNELYGALGKLKKAVQVGYPLQGSKSIIVRNGEPSYEASQLSIPYALEQELSQLFAKQRKTDFLKKLEQLFHLDAWDVATRAQWLRTLSFLVNSWMLQYPEFAKKAVEIGWNHELEETIWQASDLISLMQGLKELHASLFDAFDQDPEAEGSWTEEVKSFIDNNYMDNIALIDLANRYGLNPSYLGRVFKRKYGHSPIDYLIQIRLAKARQLIREKPRLLFKDVAEMVGYSDPFYFSKLFKQWTGQTPREYKKHIASE